KIIDERTGRIYEHQDFQNSINDYAILFAAKTNFHTHARLVAIVAGTTTIGTLGAAKLMMDSEELLKAVPRLRRHSRWPVEILLRVKAPYYRGMDKVWDVSLKD